MAVSGSFDFAITGDQLIESALRKARCISDGDSASANQLTYYRQALNLICKELVSENVGLFTIEKYPIAIAAATVTISIASPAVVSWTAHGHSIGDSLTFTTTGALPTGITAGTVYYIITAGFGANSFEISATSGGSAVNTSGTQSGVHTATPNVSFALPTKYVDILSAYVNYNSIDTPVNILTKSQYHSIEKKTMTGVPDNIMLDFTGTPTVYLYPISNMSCTLNLVVYRLIDDFDESTNNPGMPVKWYMYLLYALTTYIAEDRELPVTTVDRFREEAKQLKVRAMGNDTEKTGQRVINPSVPVV